MITTWAEILLMKPVQHPIPIDFRRCDAATKSESSVSLGPMVGLLHTHCAENIRKLIWDRKDTPVQSGKLCYDHLQTMFLAFSMQPFMAVWLNRCINVTGGLETFPLNGYEDFSAWMKSPFLLLAIHTIAARIIPLFCSSNSPGNLVVNCSRIPWRKSLKIHVFHWPNSRCLLGETFPGHQAAPAPPIQVLFARSSTRELVFSWWAHQEIS